MNGLRNAIGLSNAATSVVTGTLSDKLKEREKASISSTSKYAGSSRVVAERASMPGFFCTQCAAYYKALEDQGIATTDEDRFEMLQRCSRHKARWEPPQTPAGFWDLSVRTPDDWKDI